MKDYIRANIINAKIKIRNSNDLKGKEFSANSSRGGDWNSSYLLLI